MRWFDFGVTARCVGFQPGATTLQMRTRCRHCHGDSIPMQNGLFGQHPGWTGRRRGQRLLWATTMSEYPGMVATCTGMGVTVLDLAWKWHRGVLCLKSHGQLLVSLEPQPGSRRAAPPELAAVPPPKNRPVPVASPFSHPLALLQHCCTPSWPARAGKRSQKQVKAEVISSQCLY